jgi:hypothetical protein
MSSSKRSGNVAARMGSWSAHHRKIAIFGWLGLLHLWRTRPGRYGNRPNNAFYAAAHEPQQIWEVPGGQHIAGITTEPAEYERRVVGFFDRTLLKKGKTP